jgi:serine/threonine protein kinase
MSDSFIGTEINHYKIQSVLGEGGMGKVYLGHHTQLNKRAAIKMLLPQYLNNEDAKKRFKQDAKILESLKHDNIVELYDYLEDSTGMYLFLEFVQGRQLDDYITKVRGVIPYDEAIKIMDQVLSGLEYAHSKGIIHRDIKPGNIIVDDQLKVKIIDFGIAKMLDSDENLAKTMVNQGIGTPFYMSPEQILGKNVNERTDVYSAGLLFYEMLTGSCPYSEVSSLFVLNKMIIEEELPPPSSVYNFVPKKIDSLVKKAIEKDSNKRIKSCLEFRTMLLDKTESFSIDKSTVKIVVKNATNALIVFGDQGEEGTEADFLYIPTLTYRICIHAEGKKSITKDIVFNITDANSTKTFEMEDLDELKQTKTSMLYIIITGVLVLGLAISLAVTYVAKSDLEKENSVLRQQNNWLNAQ